MPSPTRSSWCRVAVSEDGTRALFIDLDSRTEAEGEPGFLLKAAVEVDGDRREQTIYGPNLAARLPATLVRRLSTLPDARLTPQIVTG